MSRALACSIAVLCACAPGDRADDAPADAGPLCGNGVVDPPLDVLHVEQCDEGMANGGPDSHCTKQCGTSKLSPPPASFPVDMGDTILRAVDVTADEIRVATLGANGRVRVWREEEHPAIIDLSAGGQAIALGSQLSYPFWIERAADGVHLYDAVVRDGDTPEIHEVPYPFPDGTDPEIVANTTIDSGPIIVDQSASGELLVAPLVLRSPTDVVAFPYRFPAPAGTRGITVDTGFYDEDLAHRQRQLVVFFDAPGSFIALDYLTDAPPGVRPSSIVLSEAARGDWPMRVLAGTHFAKLCPGESPLHWPTIPIAVVDDLGQVFVWQFDHGLAPGESFRAPYASLAAGTQTLSAFFGIVFALEPDGTGVLLTDGDCMDVGSTAIAPMRAPYTHAASVVSLVDCDGWHWAATAGATLYRL